MPRTPRQTKAHAASKDAAVNVGVRGDKTNSTRKKQRQFTSQEIIQAIRDADGFLKTAAEKLGCNRTTLYRRAEEPEIAQAIKESRSYIVFDAEDALRKRIQEGDTAAIIFALKTQGKNQGYIERHEVTGKDGGSLVSFADLARMVKETPNE